ncbi:hypothetical protein DSECCO2_566340 [anaerobic digester metagenome]
MRISDLQVYQFRNPEAATIQNLDDGFVPLSRGGTEVDNTQQPFNLIRCEYFRQFPADTRHLNQFCRIVPDFILQQEVFKK